MFEKKFEVKLYVPDTWEVTADMVARWAGNLKNAAEVINDRWQAKIPDDGTFINVMAARANEDFRPFVNPAYVTKGGRSVEDVGNTHKSNIVTAFNRWNDKINRAFATVDGVIAKVFKERVDATKDVWALRVGAKTLRLTGDKIRGRSVAPIAAFFLTGDRKAIGWLRPSDEAAGTPYSIARYGDEPSLRATIQQRLVQGGLMVINSEYDSDVILRQNTTTADILTGLRDPARCDAFVGTPAPDKCFCAWVRDGNLFYLHIQVGLTV